MNLGIYFKKFYRRKSIFPLLFVLMILMGLYCIPLNVSSAVTTPTEVWNRKYPASTFNVYGYDAAVAGDYIYFVGYIGGADQAAFIRKYDQDGNLIQTQLWNDSGLNDQFHAIAVWNNSIYAVGNTGDDPDKDTLLVCYDTDLNQEWNSTWDRSSGDKLNDIAIYNSSSIYVAGETTNSSTRYFALLMKYNSTGHLLWNQTWGTTAENDWGNGVAVYGPDAVYLYGSAYSFALGSSRDVFLARYDSDGHLIWNVTWGGYQLDDGHGVVTDTAHNIYVTGYTYSFGLSEAQGFIVQFNSNGQKQWNFTFNEPYGSRGWAISIDINGFLYIVGSRVEAPILKNIEDFLLVKYDSAGTKLWSTFWGNSTGNDEVGYGMAISGEDYLYATGYAKSGGLYDAVLIKFDLSPGSPGASTFLIIILPFIGLGIVSIIFIITTFIHNKISGYRPSSKRKGILPYKVKPPPPLRTKDFNN